MSKQEKKAKKVKKAEAQADVIITETIAKVKSTTWDAERKEGCSDEDWSLAVRARKLREEGEPWWAIARALELPGHGDSAVTGKKGAARARLVYKAGFGDFPRTFVKGRSKQEKNEHVRTMLKQKRDERKAIAKSGQSVIGPEVSDEEVADILKGRRIRWWVQSEIVPDGMDMEACVHPRAPLYIEGEGKDRVVEFREHHRKAPPGVRDWPAHIRTVRLSAIYQVR